MALHGPFTRSAGEGRGAKPQRRLRLIVVPDQDRRPRHGRAIIVPSDFVPSRVDRVGVQLSGATSAAPLSMAGAQLNRGELRCVKTRGDQSVVTRNVHAGCDVAEVIVAGLPFEGELTPMLGVARGLIARGHGVTVLTGSRFSEKVVGLGARFAALAGLADFDDRRLWETFPQAKTVRPGAEQLNFLFGIAAATTSDQYRGIQQLLAESPLAVLITNSVSLGHWPVALGAPGRQPRRWIAVGANPLTLPSVDTTPFGPAAVALGGDARAANLAGWRDFDAMLEPSRQQMQAAVDALGATAPVPGFAAGLATIPDYFASLTIPGLEFPRSDIPDSVRMVGILSADPPPENWNPPSWWPDLEAGRSVVTVTQGTLANTDLTELITPTLEALADQDVLVVATLGREIHPFLGPIPSNARIERFIPYSMLLPRTSVYVTNGGFGGTQQALAAGVPVVVAGDTDDKPLVAARVAYRNVGLDLGTARPQPKHIQQAVEHVLGNTTIHSNVRRIAEQYARHDAIEAIEALAIENLPCSGGLRQRCRGGSSRPRWGRMS